MLLLLKTQLRVTQIGIVYIRISAAQGFCVDPNFLKLLKKIRATQDLVAEGLALVMLKDVTVQRYSKNRAM